MYPHTPVLNIVLVLGVVGGTSLLGVSLPPGLLTPPLLLVWLFWLMVYIEFSLADLRVGLVGLVFSCALVVVCASLESSEEVRKGLAMGVRVMISGGALVEDEVT